MPLVASAVATAIKSQVSAAMPGIVGAENYQGNTPEFEAVMDAIANAVCTAVNAELLAIKTAYNAHTHVTATGATAPPIPSMT